MESHVGKVLKMELRGSLWDDPLEAGRGGGIEWETSREGYGLRFA